MRSLQALRSKAAMVVKCGFALEHLVIGVTEWSGQSEHSQGSSRHNGSITRNWGSARSVVQEPQLLCRCQFAIYQTIS